MVLNQLIEQNTQYKQILKQFTNGKNSHAYLIKTADSIFAEEMSYLLASNFTGSNYTLVQKGAHPDVLIFGKNAKIDVDAVSSIIENLAVACYQADYKVYILLGCENMGEAAQNKLLKSLEEPPRKVIFLLTAASTQLVLPTVLSRVTTIVPEPLESSLIAQILLQDGAEKNAAQIAAANAGGSITLAKKLVSDEFLNLHATVLDMLQNLDSSSKLLYYSSRLEPKTVDKKELFDVILLLLRDCTMILAGAENLVTSKFCIDKLKTIASGLNFAAINKIIAECLHCKEDLYYNTNATAVVDKFLFTLAEEKSKCKK